MKHFWLFILSDPRSDFRDTTQNLLGPRGTAIDAREVPHAVGDEVVIDDAPYVVVRVRNDGAFTPKYGHTKYTYFSLVPIGKAKVVSYRSQNNAPPELAPGI